MLPQMYRLCMILFYFIFLLQVQLILNYCSFKSYGENTQIDAESEFLFFSHILKLQVSY